MSSKEERLGVTPLMRYHPAPRTSPSLRPAASSDAPRTESDYFLPMDVSSRFGLRLRHLRRDRNLTQLRMSIDFGIDRSFISDVERGRKSISLPMLEIIALGLKITLSELLRDI